MTLIRATQVVEMVCGKGVAPCQVPMNGFWWLSGCLPGGEIQRTGLYSDAPMDGLKVMEYAQYVIANGAIRDLRVKGFEILVKKEFTTWD